MRMIPNKDSSKDLLSTIIIYGLLIASILEKLFVKKIHSRTKDGFLCMHVYIIWKTIINYWLLDCVIFNFV